jgi:hypothetical protein
VALRKTARDWQSAGTKKQLGGNSMRILASLAGGIIAGFLLAFLYMGGAGPGAVAEEAKAGAGFVAVPGEVGGQDVFGAYDVVAGWPKDISTLPGHERWTWGAAQGVFAESVNRIYMLHRGELPVLPARPASRLLPELGPSIQVPVNRLPLRDATQSSLPVMVAMYLPIFSIAGKIKAD